MSSLLLSLLHRVFPNLNIPVSEEIAVENLQHLIQGCADHHIPGGTELLRSIPYARIKKIVGSVIRSPCDETLAQLAESEAPAQFPKTPQLAHRWQVAPKDSLEPFLLVSHGKPDGVMQIADALHRSLQDNPKYKNWLNRPFKSALDLLTLCPKGLAVFPQMVPTCQFAEYQDDFLNFMCDAVKMAHYQHQTYVPTRCTTTEDENEEEERQERLILKDMFFHPKFRISTPTEDEIPLHPDAASISSSSRTPSPVASVHEKPSQDALLAPPTPHEASQSLLVDSVLPSSAPDAATDHPILIIPEMEKVPELGTPIGVLGVPAKKRVRKAVEPVPIEHGRMTRSQMRKLGNPSGIL